MTTNGITPPAKGWKLITGRRLTAGEMVYPRGSEIPASACGRNYRSWIDSRAVRWEPPEWVVSAKASPLPSQPKPLPRPKIEFVMIADDPVSSVRKTQELMLERCGGNAALMRDTLESDPAYRELLKLAMRIGCAKAKEGRKLQSVPPNQIGL